MAEFQANEKERASQRPVSHEDVRYLLDCRYPFLQMINLKGGAEEGAVAARVQADSGWTILDYGDAMCTSPARLLGSYRLAGGEGEGGEEGGGGALFVRVAQGTIVQQTFSTASQMVRMAIERGWTGIEIVSGTPQIQCAAWGHAQENDMPLIGYTATEDEQRRLERRKKTVQQIETLGPRVK